MIWLTWRQFRTEALAALAIVAAATVYLLISGLSMHHTYTADLAACPHPQDGCRLLGQFGQTYSGRLQLVELLLVAVPALIGIFWGAPMLAGEFERGTHRMVWNQSVTPTRWLAVKVTVLGLATLLTVGALSLMITWWAGPLDGIADDRFGALTFATRNVAPLGYAALAFTLGATTGLITRRVVPAMALTLALFIAVQILFAAQVRPHLLPSTAATMAINASTLDRSGGIGTGGDPNGPILVFGPGPAGAWIQSETNVEDSAGRTAYSTGEIGACFTGTGQLPSLASIGACLAPHDLHIDFTYQPASHYWPLQWSETAIYVALAGLLGATGIWRIRRHHD